MEVLSVILKFIWKEQDLTVWTGLAWLSNSGKKRQWTFDFNKRRGVYLSAEPLSVSEDEFYAVKSVF
jgi:hypothetical protein